MAQENRNLKKENIWITQDFPEEIKTNRQILLPALKAAYRSSNYKNVNLKLDKLVIDNITYTVDNMSTLPQDLQPDKTSVIETEQSIVFFTKNAIFSNLHPLPITIDGESFNCNEQYFHYKKATQFGDLETAQKIKQETNPYEMMNLAKKLRT